MFYKNNHYKQDLSKLDVSHIKSMQAMFAESAYNGDISGWDVSNVFNMNEMFKNSKFNLDEEDPDLKRVDDLLITSLKTLIMSIK